jgi:hypothetical protein
VRVYLDEAHFDYGARRSALIRKGGRAPRQASRQGKE